MKFSLIVIISILLTACSGRSSQKIIVPKLTDDFYVSALRDVDDQLSDEPNNNDLLKQKIFYCEKLDWPSGCLDALNYRKERSGMTNSLVEQFMSYYLAHDDYQLVVEFMNQWNDEYDLAKKFRRPLIESLVATNRKTEAIFEINQFIRESKEDDELVFIATQYLHMNDSLMAMYYLGKLEKLNPTDKLMLTYGKMLINLGYSTKGDALLIKYVSDVADERLAIDLAKFYEKKSRYDISRSFLKGYAERDSVAFYISTLYEKDQVWDSALMYVDTVLARNPANVLALATKGAIYENRGWLSAALDSYYQAFQLDSADTSITSKMDRIRRKIAYLQRQKFEENKVPLLEIESKKVKIDE